MKITFLGAAHEVTGSCTLLEACGKKLLIDCGLEQGKDLYENTEMPIPPKEVDAILLTHAHIDHSGKIPYLTANGFHGEIHTTRATGRLCTIMLMDSAHIQESEAEWRNRKAERSGGEPYTPLYTTRDVENTLSLFQLHDYDEEVELFEGMTIRFTDAGHLLGSASILITLCEGGETRRILFSGDLGSSGKPLLRAPAPAQKADYLVLESTYGDRLHPQEHPDYVGDLSEAIRRTLDRRGNLVIPAFAVGRTQEILYLLRIIKEKGLVKRHPSFQVYLDSPLAIETTNIYSQDLLAFFDDETLDLLARGINPLSFPGLQKTVSAEESKAINRDPASKVIISASGMCEAGRIRHHLKHNLWRRESSILFVGYQSEGTLGRELLNGAKKVRLFNEDIQVHAQIMTMQSFSSHADQKGLIAWARHAEAKMVFINHGEGVVCDTLSGRIQEVLGCKSEAPYSGYAYDLITGLCVERPEIKEKKALRRKAKSDALHDELVAAGQRLLEVIRNNKGLANRETRKFIDEIAALSRRYQRDAE